MGWIIALLVIFLLGCTESFIDEDTVNSIQETDNVVKPGECDSGETFGCAPVSQGILTDQPAPEACGCIPECSAPYHLVVSASQDKWEDGSIKGIFECTTSDVP